MTCFPYTEDCVRLTPGYFGTQPNITTSNGAILLLHTFRPYTYLYLTNFIVSFMLRLALYFLTFPYSLILHR
jgi:hypothetical protein